MYMITTNVTGRGSEKSEKGFVRRVKRGSHNDQQDPEHESVLDQQTPWCEPSDAELLAGWWPRLDATGLVSHILFPSTSSAFKFG